MAELAEGAKGLEDAENDQAQPPFGSVQLWFVCLPCCGVRSPACAARTVHVLAAAGWNLEDMIKFAHVFVYVCSRDRSPPPTP